MLTPLSLVRTAVSAVASRMCDPAVVAIDASSSSPRSPIPPPSTRVRLQIVSVIGGVRYTQPITAQVVVATPGKIQEVLKNRVLDLSGLKVGARPRDAPGVAKRYTEFGLR